jgi:hypothetical protein
MTNNNEGDKEWHLEDKQVAEIMAKALYCMLKDQEGIAIEDENERYIVYRDGVTIKVNESITQGIFGEKLTHGQMLWVHDDDEFKPGELN